MHCKFKLFLGYPDAAAVACSHNLGSHFHRNKHFVGCLKEIRLGERAVNIREPTSQKYLYIITRGSGQK